MITQLVLREYSTGDYRDIVEAGYNFYDLAELKPLNLCKDRVLRTFDVLEEGEKRVFVAYSPKERKVVGIITLRKITDRLWGLWNIFVSPTHRRQGIGSWLYHRCFEYLKRRGVERAVGSVAVTNIPSIRSLEKTWDGFLSQKFYYYSGAVPLVKIRQPRNIRIQDFSYSDGDALFETYKECVGEDWHTFLEIGKENFLERFIDYMHGRGLIYLLLRKHFLIAEERDTISGYILMVQRHFPKRFKKIATLYLFLSPMASQKAGKTLLSYAFHNLLIQRVSTIYMSSIAKKQDWLEQTFADFGLHAEPNLVPIKRL